MVVSLAVPSSLWAMIQSFFKKEKTMKNNRLIVLLGDQLCHQISSLDCFDPNNDSILMMEVMQEATYVKHHVHKITLLFSAMRHFADELKRKKFKVHYITLDDPANQQSFSQNLIYHLKQNHFDEIVITEPGEYRVLEMIAEWRDTLPIPVTVRADNRFYCSIVDFYAWAKGKKQLRMENFYRLMRQKTGILMQADQPIGGRWNFDHDNRKPANNNVHFPPRPTLPRSQITQQVIALVKKQFPDHMGDPENFQLAVTRDQALLILDDFIANHLRDFGTYQDAMLNHEYSLNHSFLSAYINCGLLTAREVIQRAEQAYKQKKAPINSAEGFIRQILGWREFIRGIYWLKIPEYRDLNYFNARRALPDFYWNANTDMACMRHAIKQTLETATSHHIQRLMLTGNFALLYGADPAQVCEWYLAVYADAYEWVELPNTLGMALFADGGIVGSKPYAASGNYINKMSNFCQDCRYNVKEKLSEQACPFNYLYWAFLIRHEKKLANNMRMKFAYQHIKKLSESEKQKYLNRAKKLDI